MKRDEYGPKIEALLAATDKGLSVSEIVDEVGCSRQRIYNWITKNRHRVRATGRTEHGATTFTLRTDDDLTPEGNHGVQVGDNVMIRTMRWTGETLLLGLEAEDGTELRAVVTAEHQ